MRRIGEKMTVSELSTALGASAVALPSPGREIKGAYIGDLLSWVMGQAREGCAWITIMSNVNVIAVASLADVACVILAEGTTLDDGVLETARQRGVNVLSSPLPSYETAIKLYSALR